jgi:hypothetical protein
MSATQERPVHFGIAEEIDDLKSDAGAMQKSNIC